MSTPSRDRIMGAAERGGWTVMDDRSFGSGYSTFDRGEDRVFVQWKANNGSFSYGWYTHPIRPVDGRRYTSREKSGKTDAVVAWLEATP